MKLSPSNFAVYKENTTVKRLLLVIGTAVLLLNTLVTPAVVRADGGSTGTNCDGKMCKP